MNDVLKKLESAILAGRTLHAYLLTGQDPAQTERAARDAASLMLYSRKGRKLLMNDPDYMEYEGNISIGEFRDVIRPEIYRETFGKAGRVVVIKGAERLSQAVQNAMLKVIEEPPSNTRFILTGSEYGILPTIRSRCMIIRCAVPDTDEIKAALIEKGASGEDALKYANMSGGMTARAIRLYESEEERAFRVSAVDAFVSALRSSPDFKWSRTKRERAAWTEANELLLLYCHDLMRCAAGMKAEFFADRGNEPEKISSYFTIGEIGSMIELLKENAKRLATNASGGASFDRLFADLALLGLKKRNQ